MDKDSKTCTSTRVLWLDVLKGLCMIMIVLSHSAPPYLYSRFYTPCFLSGFFFASGYTINTDLNFKEYLCHKLKGLMYPFLTLGSINAVLAIFVEGDSIGERAQFLLSRSGMWDDMWFVSCLFSAQIVYWFVTHAPILKNANTVVKCMARILISLVITLLGLLYVDKVGQPLLWQFENACICVVFLALGDAFREMKIEDKLMTNAKMMVVVVLIYVVAVLAYDNPVSVHDEKYNSWFVYFVSAIIGIICNTSGWAKRILVYIGQNTLIFYAFQSKAIKVSFFVLNKVIGDISPYISCVLVSIGATSMLLIAVYIVNKYFRWIVKL